MANYNTVITNEGAALLASVIANHGTITFTDLKLSENDYTGQEATMTAGTFDGVFANVSVASSIVDITTIKVSATVHGYNFSGDHNLYALGVIGTDGNTTALIAICTTTNPDVLRDNSSTYAFNINLTVSSTSNITVVGTTAAALYTTDIVDNLTSAATDKPLSANMGKKLSDEKQDKTLATPITVDGTQETTVEGALGALNTYSDKIKDNLSNRNLVDNGWFTVNQRGAGTITSGFGADRWKFVEGTSATFSSNGVSLDNSFICQVFENQLPNGVYTASVKYQDGTIEHGTAIKADDSTAITFFTSSTGFKLMYIPLAKRFDVNGKNGSTTSIRAVKLEVGSVSTLHLDVAPDYTTELLKCQRYFYRLTNTSMICASFASSVDVATAIFNLPVPMRTTPTFTYGGAFYLRYMGANESITNITAGGSNNEITSLSLTILGTLTIGQAGYFNASSTSAYLDFSADL